MQSESDRRDQNVLYEPNERPPNTITFALGFQAAMLCIAGIVITPVIVVRAAGGGEPYISWVVFAALTVSGLTTVLQAVRVGRIGAGYVSPYGHFWRFYRGLRDGACRGRASDARNSGHHFIVVPIRALDSALAAAANYYANRGWNGDHVDRGNRYAHCL